MYFNPGNLQIMEKSSRGVGNRGAESGSNLVAQHRCWERGAWESTKYQLEGKLLLTMCREERENEKGQSEVSFLKKFCI